MSYDLILAGGGLANGLIAWRLKQTRPELRILCVEEQAHLGGNHTWSFHDNDLNAIQHEWIRPLVVQAWPAYDVHFPDHSRRLNSGYASITSERFSHVVKASLGDDLRLGENIAQVSPHAVFLASGESLNAKAVIDGRGVEHSKHMVLGQQAFLGQLLKLQGPHGLDAPVIMDARVAQGNGYRFMYVLPFSADTVLVEDTHYIDHDGISSEQHRTNIAQYVKEQGWIAGQCLREERGVLPITLAGDFDAFWGETQGQPRSGLRAGLYHCTTGYSLPHAVQLADWIAQQEDFESYALFRCIRAFAHQSWQRQSFYRLLNRMLFLAGKPQDRWRVMQRFYSLPEGLISRFYSGGSGIRDKMRVLIGKPPVPIHEAMQAALRSLPRHYEK